jgi:hypothetical protein
VYSDVGGCVRESCSSASSPRRRRHDQPADQFLLAAHDGGKVSPALDPDDLPDRLGQLDIELECELPPGRRPIDGSAPVRADLLQGGVALPKAVVDRRDTSFRSEAWKAADLSARISPITPWSLATLWRGDDEIDGAISSTGTADPIIGYRRPTW